MNSSNYNPYISYGEGNGLTIDQNFALLHQKVDAYNALTGAMESRITKRIDTISRAPKRKLVNIHMANMDNGQIVVVNTYDNGERDAVPFILNAYGKWKTYQVEIREETNSRFFVIEFTGITIVGEYQRLSAEYLYSLFVKAGVKFNSCIAIGKIKRILFETFASEIENSSSSLKISKLTGWFNQKFMHAEVFCFDRNKSLHFPVMQKTLTKLNQQLAREVLIINYIKEMKKIVNYEERLIVMLYPYASMIASLLEAEQCRLQLVVNIIPCKSYSIQDMATYFQIFNRNKIAALSGNVTSKNMNEMLRNFKDEVFFCDFRTYAGATQYEKEKLKKMQEKLLAMVSNTHGQDDIYAPFGAVMLSDNVIFSNNVVNVFWSEDYIRDMRDEDELHQIQIDAIGMMFTFFIQFLESDIVNVLQRMKAIKNKKSVVSSLDVTFDILKGFEKWLGYEFLESLEISKTVDFQEILETKTYNPEEMLDVFIHAIREEASKYYFITKNDKKDIFNAIRYNQDSIWISTQLMHEIMKNHGLVRNLNNILVQLRQQNKLKTDRDGMTRKLQVGNVRTECFEFERNLFNSPGMPDIVSLGKEF